jgi:NAD(P)H dehydrogenase (quinone)
MTIVVTGATGHLGSLVVESLLRTGTPAAEIVAAGRSVGKLDDLAARGVRVARIDFTEPATLEAAFAGADTVLLVSSSEVGQRAAQHIAAIDAAKATGVGRLVYTSAPGATTSALILAPEHKATEEYLVASGIPFTILRNGWYTENFEPALRHAETTGVVLASAGDGRVASATREDYAEAIASVLAQDGHAGQTYELSGDVAWSFDELAAALTEVLDREVTYRRLTPEQHLAELERTGVDESTARFLVALDANIEDGALDLVTGDLSRLLGRRTTGLVDALRMMR